MADQALLWVGKAQVGGADPANAAGIPPGAAGGHELISPGGRAGQQLAGSDPEAKARRGEILLELADTQQLAKQYKEAAATYGQSSTRRCCRSATRRSCSDRSTALHLAGDFNGSDQACDRFQQAYPRSTLLPAVLFRHAENAYFWPWRRRTTRSLPNRAKEVAPSAG